MLCNTEQPEQLNSWLCGLENMLRDATAGPGLHGIERIVPASSNATRNPAIVIGAVCGLLGGLLLLATGLLAILARRRALAASRKLADEGQAEKGVMPVWLVRQPGRGPSTAPDQLSTMLWGWRARMQLHHLCTCVAFHHSARARAQCGVGCRA